MRLNSQIIALVILLASSVAGAAQSTSSSNPTPLNSAYSGKGPSKETNYYFSFTGGPGEVSVTLEIKAKDYSTFARLEIGNDPSNLIAMHNMNASTSTGPSTVTKQFKLSIEQSVRIKLTLDHNLAEYTLSINGGGGFGGSTGSNSTVGKIGKQSAGSGAKLGSIGSGSKPKTGALGSTGGGGNKLTFTCPAEVMYKIVPAAGWNGGLHGQKRYLFSEAAAVDKQLWCNYQSLDGKDSATIYQVVPTGYTCERYNGGPKSRDFICTQGITAGLTNSTIINSGTYE